MAAKPVCLVCKKEMELGFLTDLGHSAIYMPRWCPGEPTTGFWTQGEAKVGQYETGLKVVAYRCPECEALRLYAPSAAR